MPACSGRSRRVRVPIETVAREGDDVGAGITIKSLPSSTVPSINATGAVAFRATLSGAMGGSGIFVATPGSTLQQVVSAREQSDTGGKLVRLRDPVIADDGSVVVPASQTGSGPSLFVYRAGAIIVARQDRETTDIDTGLERFRFSDAERARRRGARRLRGQPRRRVRRRFRGRARDGRVHRRSHAARRHVRRLRSARRRCRGRRHLRRRHRGQRHREPRSDRASDSRGVRAVARGSERVAGATSWSTSSPALSTRSPGPTSVRRARWRSRRRCRRQDATRAPLHARRQAAAGRAREQGRSRRRNLRQLRDAGHPARQADGVRGAGRPRREHEAKMFLMLGSRTRVLAAQGGGAPGAARRPLRRSSIPPTRTIRSSPSGRRSTRPATRASSWHRRARSACWWATRIRHRGAGRSGRSRRSPSGGSQAVFQARLAGSPASAAPLPGAVPTAVPAADATAPAVQRLGAPVIRRRSAARSISSARSSSRTAATRWRSSSIWSERARAPCSSWLTPAARSFLDRLGCNQ